LCTSKHKKEEEEAYHVGVDNKTHERKLVIYNKTHKKKTKMKLTWSMITIVNEGGGKIDESGGWWKRRERKKKGGGEERGGDKKIE
jgi:hypothetical protein